MRCPIIDAHAHLGRSPDFYFPDSSWQTLLGVMDRLGIDKCLSTHLGMLSSRFQEGLEESLEAFQGSQGRIINLLVFNPNHPAQTMRCIQDHWGEDPFVGIKIHPSFHNIYADDQKYQPIWEYANSVGATVLTHSYDKDAPNPVQKYSWPPLFRGYLERYPRVKLILGHAGGRYGGHVAAVKLAKDFPNVYVDLAGDSFSFGLLEWLVEQVGEDRVLFGSDLTWNDPRTHLGRVLGAKISDQAKRKILGLNAEAVFGLNLT